MITLEFAKTGLGPEARAQGELTPETAKELCDAVDRAITAAESAEAEVLSYKAVARAFRAA